jgi:conjugal transfer pilus assembly protein TrbC
MNKKTLNVGLINKKSLKSFVSVLSAIFLFAICGPSLANNEDYAAYAKEQQEKAKRLMAPYQAQVNEIIKNVEKRQAQPDIQAFKKEMQNVAKTQCPMQALVLQEEQKEKHNHVPIIIFVSFSMPKESIKGWITQAQKPQASVYIRGLVNNSFKDTKDEVAELVKDQSGGLLIDPSLFQKFGIMQVPAVVVTKNDNFDVIYGDVSLDYALEKISDSKQGAEKEELLKIIKQLRTAKHV